MSSALIGGWGLRGALSRTDGLHLNVTCVHVQPEKPKAEAPAPEPVKAVEKAQPKKAEPKPEPAKVEAKKEAKKEETKKKKSNGFKLFGAQVLTAGAIGGLGYAAVTKGDELEELQAKADRALMKVGPLKQ